MKDDEMELWRRQWHGRPEVVVDLIRRVERETVEMRMGRLAFLGPVIVASMTTVLVVSKPSLFGILFVGGLWVFVGIGLWLATRSMKGVWTPAAETTTAYLELSIERCRRKIKTHRSGVVLSVLVTGFVLSGTFMGVFDTLKKAGVMKTAVGYWIVMATFVWSGAVTLAAVGYATYLNYKNRTKTQTELAYLLELQRQLKNE